MIISKQILFIVQLPMVFIRVFSNKQKLISPILQQPISNFNFLVGKISNLIKNYFTIIFNLYNIDFQININSKNARNSFYLENGIVLADNKLSIY